MATTNPWKQFSGLLPQPARIIGTVTGHNSNGTSTLVLHNGASFTAKGQEVPIHSKALIEDGTIVRLLPELPVFTANI